MALRGSYRGNQINMLIATKIHTSMLSDEKLLNCLSSNFNCFYPENEAKMGYLSESYMNYDFRLLDKIIDFVHLNDQAMIRGHCLVWHLSIPEWLKNGDYSSADVWWILTNYIRIMLQRYDDVFQFWDVVNEAMDEDGNIRQSFWSEKLGGDWIIKVFKIARANTSASLFYCDYRIKNRTKWDAIYNLVLKLQRMGLCDGISIQMQCNTFPPPALISLAYWIKRFRDGGLIVHVPEIIVWSRMGNADHWLVDRAYHDICKTCVDLGVELIGFWSIFQNYPWHWDYNLKDNARSWLFDSKYKPLKVWEDIRNV